MATDATFKGTRRVYSAEELHRLRNTQSQPKLSESIEEHEAEDAELVKEHVLRGSKSFTDPSFPDRHSNATSLRVPRGRLNNENSSLASHDALHPPALSAPQHSAVLGEIASNNQLLRGTAFKPGRSPTPSLKKAAVEAIVKSHGSPSHIRVTAGGRIVPSEQSPLCQPRYGYSAIQMNGGLIKFAPNNRYNNRSELVQATNQHGNIVQDQQGNYFQIINQTLMPLEPRPDGSVMLHSNDVPNLSYAQRAPSQGSVMPPFRPAVQVPAPAATLPVVPEPSVHSQIVSLEAKRLRLDDELREINKQEAKNEGLTRLDKERIYARRKELVLALDRIRRSLLALRRPPIHNNPSPPRGRHGRQSMSPSGRGRLPPLLQGAVQNNVATQPFGHVFGPPQPSFNPPPNAVPAPDESFPLQWAYAPPGVFTQLPSFDGATAPPIPSTMPQMTHINDVANIAGGIPQTDGARSFSELRSEPAERSHAVSITAPASMPTSSTRSRLDPTSPAYKPSAGVGGSLHERRTAPSDSPVQKLPALPENDSKSSAATDNTVSPLKKDTLVHSSSVSSFATADFFPHNPREHSSRQHTYGESGNKENDNPEPDQTPGRYTIASRKARAENSPGPAPPPGTPVYYSVPATHAPHPAKASAAGRLPISTDLARRDAHNISPKNKREYAFVYEDPGQSAGLQSSSPPDTDKSHDEAGAVDLRDKSREWLEGYATGLQRRAFQPTRGNEWLDGYCDGLKASATRSVSVRPSAPVNGSPSKASSRRPSPANLSYPASTLQPMNIGSHSFRPPFEANTTSLDCLKQAVAAAQIESALTASDPHGTHVADSMSSLGAWTKKQYQPGPTVELPGLGCPLPQRNITAGRQGIMSDGNNEIKSKIPDDRASDHMPTSRPSLLPTLSAASIAPGSVGMGGRVPTPVGRVTSLGSIESSLFNQWPGNRVMTPGEWRSAASAQNAGLNTGFFAHGQFDGTADRFAMLPRAQELTSGVPGAAQRITSDSHARTTAGGRFREDSIDRITSPPTSPQPVSPPFSPNGTPPRRDSKKRSPRKGPSPTKTKIESLAGKVGIKVTSPTPSEAGDDTADANSPSNKRHWGVRDWIKGTKSNNA